MPLGSAATPGPAAGSGPPGGDCRDRSRTHLLAALLAREDLTAADTRWAMTEVMDDALQPAQLGPLAGAESRCTCRTQAVPTGHGVGSWATATAAARSAASAAGSPGGGSAGLASFAARSAPAHALAYSDAAARTPGLAASWRFRYPAASRRNSRTMAVSLPAG